MGKKTYERQQDPILRTDFKYEQRKKAKIIEKQQQMEERSRQEDNVRMRQEVEREVDRKLNLAMIATHIANNNYKKINKLRTLVSRNGPNNLLQNITNQSSQNQKLISNVKPKSQKGILSRKGEIQVKILNKLAVKQIGSRNGGMGQDGGIGQDGHTGQQWTKIDHFVGIPEYVKTTRNVQLDPIRQAQIQAQNQIRQLFGANGIQPINSLQVAPISIDQAVSVDKTMKQPLILEKCHSKVVIPVSINDRVVIADVNELFMEGLNRNRWGNFISKSISRKNQQQPISKNEQQPISINEQSLIHFNNNSSNEPSTTTPSSDPLEIAQALITNQIDTILIEGKQESTIEQFRLITLKHILKRMQDGDRIKQRGFTNCRALILTPYVGDAKTILDLLEENIPKIQEENIQNLLQENTQKMEPNRRSQEQVIGSSNTPTLRWTFQGRQKFDSLDDQQDFFRVGLNINFRKRKIRYYANFDASHLIIASPVGLVEVTSGSKKIRDRDGGGQEQTQKNNVHQQQLQQFGETSFLSSLQVCYIDRASAILMQNWNHMGPIFNSMNRMPSYKSLKNNINQIRPCFTKLQGRLYRQNIVFSEYNFPQLNGLRNRMFHNWEGWVCIKPVWKGDYYQQPQNTLPTTKSSKSI